MLQGGYVVAILSFCSLLAFSREGHCFPRLCNLGDLKFRQTWEFLWLLVKMSFWRLYVETVYCSANPHRGRLAHAYVALWYRPGRRDMRIWETCVLTHVEYWDITDWKYRAIKRHFYFTCKVCLPWTNEVGRETEGSTVVSIKVAYVTIELIFACDWPLQSQTLLLGF